MPRSPGDGIVTTVLVEQADEAPDMGNPPESCGQGRGRHDRVSGLFSCGASRASPAGCGLYRAATVIARMRGRLRDDSGRVSGLIING